MSEQKNELRQIITDALVSMVSGVTGLVPPARPGQIPDFIQAPIDRAVERISASLPVGVPDGCVPVSVELLQHIRAHGNDEIRPTISALLAAAPTVKESLSVAPTVKTNKAQPEVAENTGSHAMANQLQRQGLAVSTEVDGAATPSEASDADDRKCEAPNCGCADAFCKAWPDHDDAAPAVKAEQVQCEECGGNGAGGDHEDDCSKAPSLPAAGSAVEEVEVAAFLMEPDLYEPYVSLSRDSRCDHVEPLMTVAQHNRIIAALSAQQSAPERVSVPVELLQDLHDLASDAVEHHRAAFAGYKLKRQANMDDAVNKARALLESHAEGGKV